MTLVNLLSTAAASDKVEKVKELLILCDSIYYTGRHQRFNGKQYGPNDLPTDEAYESYRKQFTPDFKPTDYFILSTPKGDKEKLIKHEYPMGSLSKYKGAETNNLKIVFARVGKKKDSIFWSGKVDGVSMRCYFQDGVLTRAVTRYDHTLGREVTDKAALFVPRPDPSFRGKIIVRGEVVMRGDSYKSLGYRNRRNGAAGILGQEKKYTNVKEELRFIAYELTDLFGEDGEQQLPHSQVERFAFLEKVGFETAPHGTMPSSDLKEESLAAILEKSAAGVDYDMDGLVISPTLYEEEIDDPPKMKVAFKVQTGGEWTVVTSIEPRATRTGNVIPQVYIDSVTIAGSNIHTIAGANYNVIAEKDIRVGSKVLVVKSGEVIPFISEVDNNGVSTSKTLYPKQCPSCSTPLEQIGTQRIIQCVNLTCPEKLLGQTTRFIELIGVVGVGSKRLGALGVDTIEGLYNLSVLDIMLVDGFGKAIGQSLFDQLRSRIASIEEDTLLASIAPPTIGLKTSQLIVKHIDIVELFGDTPLDVGRLSAIHGIGPERIKQLTMYHRQGSNLLKLLKSHGMKIKKVKKASETGTEEVVALTGRGLRTRIEYDKLIISKGWRSVSSISSHTTILVTNSPDAVSKKMTDARSLGIKIVNYEEFEKMLSA